MNKAQRREFLIVLSLGLVGVLSLLMTELPIPEDIKKEVLKEFTPTQFKWLSLINPFILVALATILGVFMRKKAGFDLPLISRSNPEEAPAPIRGILLSGLYGGLASGCLIVAIATTFEPFLPSDFLKASEEFELHVLTRFLYGGLAEEILMRYGLMTLFVFLLAKITKDFRPSIYWIGIGIASILFALGHFPLAYQLVESPDFTLLAYVLIANSVGGIIFGYLYWKKGLESSMIAHVVTHAVMVSLASIF